MVARHDLTRDPALRDELLVVRRGTAWFHRQVDSLTDRDLDAPSLLPGWTRRHVVAHVGYNARAITRLVEWANTGVETPMYDSPQARAEEIERGATQPPRALRHLTQHAAITLDVSWRDSPDEAWTATVRTAQGRTVLLKETVWMRTREVWLHAIDLDQGAAFSDVPRPVLSRLLTDITGHWQRTGAGDHVCVTVSDDAALDWGGGPKKIRGSLAAVVGWASGRTDLLLEQGTGVPSPRWI